MMKEKMITRRLILRNIKFLFILFFFAFCRSSEAENLKKAASQESSENIDASKYLPKGDTLFVIHFHPIVQCSCCINVGIFAQKGLEKYYVKPYKEKRIIFKECNIDQDTLTAQKYKIFWSALGFEKFSPKKNEFKEIESVWEFCEEEKKFLLNFKKELDQFMGASKKDKPRTNTQSKEGK